MSPSPICAAALFLLTHLGACASDHSAFREPYASWFVATQTDEVVGMEILVERAEDRGDGSVTWSASSWIRRPDGMAVVTRSGSGSLPGGWDLLADFETEAVADAAIRDDVCIGPWKFPVEVDYPIYILDVFGGGGPGSFGTCLSASAREPESQALLRMLDDLVRFIQQELQVSEP